MEGILSWTKNVSSDFVKIFFLSMIKLADHVGKPLVIACAIMAPA
jgi:hypothetical protein